MRQCLSSVAFRQGGHSLLAVVALCAILSTGAARANEEPFKIKGGGEAAFLPLPGGLPATHYADGTATHLGKYHAEGLFQATAFTGPTTADFKSAAPIVFTAANGDELWCNYSGTVEITFFDPDTVATVWVATFKPIPALSTGRFAKVTGGSFEVTAVSGVFDLADINIPYTWSGSGSLTFKNGK